ncbi:hypothetical protein AJ85_09260 [Alkalihalobacillus alcalophilus ATCC 27647 = CGMCC 1.3604]|uniref:HTH araC/xylS-type domain-containing protein n=1 Tax=Alkalihalobacillus alcalophilus ATCC 27647 = CGMCC 1.3604 TaxID=1218173 RepID=A0A094WIK8_ALKAL|nr:helix-turn-helix domain-containing protein [Alkalihalobacillus alcalophilus]KGA97634.1 hypothetical protein BALCAV_0209305 [Alkalihalobacillus alcalophilus ATCC 27647 = CGMCC 1.3604]MED1561423.1 AraC family transcriptional regulator [Alkalihalobacillus alcalophilus]THG90697.1 hypothetical protein AJ85_09260 [Alkalihalobacillus alcalophilus ATCC 27647 = CGMCC 1.3604]
MKKRKTKFYFKLLAFILIVSTFPVAFVGTFSYIKVSDSMLAKASEEQKQNIHQRNINVEQVLNTIDHSLTYFVNSSFLTDTLQQPMGAVQFQRYRQLKHELNYLQSFDTGIEDILILSFNHNWKINNEGLNHLDEQEIDEHYSKYLQSYSGTEWLLEKKKNTPAHPPDEEVEHWESQAHCDYSIQLVKQLPLVSSSKTGLAVVSIPSCSLSNILTTSGETEQVMILDENFRILAHNNPSLIGEYFEDVSIIENIDHTDTNSLGQIATSLDMTESTITYKKSDYNGWLYLSIISNQELKQEANAIGLFTLLVCVSIIMTCFIFSWFGSKRLYKPIKELYKTLMTNMNHSSSPKQHRDEFEAIGDQIHHMLEENKVLETKLHGQIDQLKHLFSVRLLDGQLKEEELLNIYSSYHFTKNWHHLCVLSLQIDSLENTSYTNGQKDLLLFSINSIVEDNVPTQRRLTPIIRKDVQVTILLSTLESQESFEEYIHEVATSIQTKVQEELGLSVSIGVSHPYAELSSTREAYLEGVEVLKYRLKFGQNSILYYKDIEAGSSFQTYFPENVKNELFDFIKLGEKDKAEEALERLIATIFSKDLTPNQYQISLMRLLNDLILLMQTLGIELENVDDKKSLFDQFFELKSIEEITNWFRDHIIYPLIQSIQERIQSKYKNISENIIHIIQKEYDTELSLESIAERLHYNPNYLSSIFRKETNISFSEYLSMYRLNMAKQWLIESDLSIKEIAEKFHYNNSQNFIRSFKKKKGITPGKYRELHAKKKFE